MVYVLLVVIFVEAGSIHYPHSIQKAKHYNVYVGINYQGNGKLMLWERWRRGKERYALEGSNKHIPDTGHCVESEGVNSRVSRWFIRCCCLCLWIFTWWCMCQISWTVEYQNGQKSRCRPAHFASSGLLVVCILHNNYYTVHLPSATLLQSGPCEASLHHFLYWGEYQVLV